MPISDDRKAQILRYYFAEHWRVGTIARQLGVHHSTVEGVLRAAGIERERQRQRRASMLDPYLAFLTETLEQFPTLSAARLFDMAVARGYPGGADNFRHRIAQLRPPRRREAYLRLRTLPGEQAQVDWAGDFRTVFWCAVIPALIAVALLIFGVQEPGSGAAMDNASRARRRLLVCGRRWRGVHAGPVQRGVPDSARAAAAPDPAVTSQAQ